MKNTYFVCDNEVFIKLNNGFWTIINLEDLEVVQDFTSWWYVKLPSNNNKAYYVACTNNKVVSYIHRIILNLVEFDPNRQTDHINRDGLDNRRSNLRITNTKLNNFNKNLQSNNTSGAKGVCWNKKDQVWQAYITVNRKHIHLGTFYKKEDAIKARTNAEDGYLP